MNKFNTSVNFDNNELTLSTRVIIEEQSEAPINFTQDEFFSLERKVSMHHRKAKLQLESAISEGITISKYKSILVWTSNGKEYRFNPAEIRLLEILDAKMEKFLDKEIVTMADMEKLLSDYAIAAAFIHVLSYYNVDDLIRKASDVCTEIVCHP